MSKIGIFYGSTTGNCEAIAQKIKDEIGEGDVHNILDVSAEEITGYDLLLLGSSTWGYGDLQDDWYSGLQKISKLDLSGKKIGLFGTGDQMGYPDTFCDAIGLIYEALQSTNAKFIGSFVPEGYDYTGSKAEADGEFLGLAIDEDNQPELTDERIQAWVRLIQSEM